MNLKTDDLYYTIDLIEGDGNSVAEMQWYESNSPTELCNWLKSRGLVFYTYDDAKKFADKINNLLLERVD